MRKFLIFIWLFSLAWVGLCQPSERRISREEYIEIYKDDAIREMQRTGVPASITLAQGILESADGNSPLAKYARNHFGIKCHRSWDGQTFYQDDDEKNECFRKYRTVYKSYKDHSDFLSNRSRYASLFLLKTTDYKGWARGLRKAGYATNPKYANLLIKLVEDNDLGRFDRIKKMKPIRSEKKKMKRKVDLIPIPKKAAKIHENDIRFTTAQKGDSYYKIARRFEMSLWQILKYNDLQKGDQVTTGEIIYLQPKRVKARVPYHTVLSGETVRDVSQKYGIRINSIYKLNNLTIGDELILGQKLSLRKKVK